MLYSVRMRAAKGGAHEKGGKHISGAERIVNLASINTVMAEMLERATTHTRGRADFINFTVEEVTSDNMQQVEILPSYTCNSQDMTESREYAKKLLIKAGVSSDAVKKGFHYLNKLPESMRGAMIVCAKTGDRIDNTDMRGIRVSRMDILNEDDFIKYLKRSGTYNMHVREAMILASKVVSAPGVLAELCWSDDPEYTTGYVASKQGYFRLTNIKPLGSDIGGRIFFVEKNAELFKLKKYLETTPVLVTVPVEGDSFAYISK